MKYFAIANFAWQGKTYQVGDEVPENSAMLAAGLIDAEAVEEEDFDDGAIQGDYEGA